MKIELIPIKKELHEIKESQKYLLQSLNSPVTSMQDSTVNTVAIFSLENGINLPTKNLEELQKLQKLLKENEKRRQFVSTICLLMYSCPNVFSLSNKIYYTKFY